jgi:hypothetical protein
VASIEDKLLRAIKRGGTGQCFTARNFLRLGGPEAVWQALSRLERRGIIRRLAKGLYDYPRRHPGIGLLSPEPEAVAKAITERDASQLQPTGAYAANLLGLSEQVPAKVEFLTSGPGRKVKIGRREIILKSTVPRNMATAGRISGTVIQALRHIGKDHVSPDHVAQLRKRLSGGERAQLWEDRLNAPMWLLPILEQICRGTE